MSQHQWEPGMGDHISKIESKTNSTLGFLRRNLKRYMSLKKSMRDDITWQKLSETDIRSKSTDKLESFMSDYILKNCMFTTEISTHSKNDIDKCINDIKNMMCLASKLLPRQKPKGHAQPYWCPELTVLCRAKKQAWREWVKADRPRNDDSPLYGSATSWLKENWGPDRDSYIINMSLTTLINLTKLIISTKNCFGTW